jgi:hypothetical protein
MRHSIPWVICLGVLLAASASLNASTVLFTFTDTDNAVFTASGTLNATDNGNGTFTVTSGSGFFNTDPITLIPGSGTSPSGLFIYNNVLYPNGNPLLDIDGLLFTDTITGAELNIWGNGAYPPSFYSTYTGLGGGYPLQDNNSVFTLAGIPEPSTWWLIVTGLGLIVGERRRHQRLGRTRWTLSRDRIEGQATAALPSVEPEEPVVR